MADGKPITLVARTEIDGVMMSTNQEVSKLTIKAFNEWDSQVIFLLLFYYKLFEMVFIRNRD